VFVIVAGLHYMFIIVAGLHYVFVIVAGLHYMFIIVLHSITADRVHQFCLL